MVAEITAAGGRAARDSHRPRRSRGPPHVAVDRAVAAFGGLDVLVGAVGIQRYGTAADTTDELWQEVLAVEPHRRPRADPGRHPAAADRAVGRSCWSPRCRPSSPRPAVAAYTVSKAAVNALVRSIAVDEAPYGIRANAVCPGSVDTPMLRASARRFSDGTDAGAEALLAEWGRSAPAGPGRPAGGGRRGRSPSWPADRASFVTGTAVVVDGGLIATIAVRDR